MTSAGMWDKEETDRMLKDVTPIIENTSMQIYDDKTYWIKPNEGYKLHEKIRDVEDVDPETGKPILILGFNESISTCSINYDFEINEREFYTIPIGENPTIILE
jgi:hypothetical protein